MAGSPKRAARFDEAVRIQAAQRLLSGEFDKPFDATLTSLRDVLACAREESVPSIKRLAWLRDNAKQEVVQLSASIALLDRAWGKPHQMVMTKEIGCAPPLDYSKYTSEELMLLERLLAKGAPVLDGSAEAIDVTPEAEPAARETQE